jgi:hypothetical protein
MKNTANAENADSAMFASRTVSRRVRDPQVAQPWGFSIVNYGGKVCSSSCTKAQWTIRAVAVAAPASREIFAMRQIVMQNMAIPRDPNKGRGSNRNDNANSDWAQSEVLLSRDVSQNSLNSLGRTVPSITLQLWHETSIEKSHG